MTIPFFLFKCRRCGLVHKTVLDPEITEASVLTAQVSVHRCEGTTADGHARWGISDMVGYNTADEEAGQ